MQLSAASFHAFEVLAATVWSFESACPMMRLKTSGISNAASILLMTPSTQGELGPAV